MSTGSWIPESEKANLELPSESDLTRWSSLSDDDIAQLDQTSINTLSRCINAGVEHWQPHLASLSDEHLIRLLKFFTLLEMAHPALRADKHNPAIACAKLLRSHGSSLDKSLLQWIRSVSDNRFLPYGPL